MENKRTKKALDDEMLDGVTGGNGGDNTNFLTKTVTESSQEADLINKGVCPNYYESPSDHMMLEPDGCGNFLCKRCGILWNIAK
jgi:hypothetical protein